MYNFNDFMIFVLSTIVFNLHSMKWPENRRSAVKSYSLTRDKIGMNYYILSEYTLHGANIVFVLNMFTYILIKIKFIKNSDFSLFEIHK